MNKQEKAQIINELVELINSTDKIYLVDCSTINGINTNLMRRSCFEKKVKMRVAKNTLIEKAIEQSSRNDVLKDMIPHLKGETAILFSFESPNAPAKIIKEFKEKCNGKPVLKAAYVEETLYIGDESVETLAQLKSKNELIAEVISLLQSPIRRVISALENKKGEENAA
ncbi:MAG: 50S ribosomal protein L10 [Bacteroidia bacterium]|nr:MAG: 50S ribosomal protein L10 [Bacteroidia bacterium]